jgi:hypothetical protein
MALADDRLPDLGLRPGQQVARHVAGRDPHLAHQQQREVRDVLAHPGAGVPGLGGRGVHAGGRGLVLQVLVIGRRGSTPSRTISASP